MITQKTIDEIFQVAQIEEVVGDFVHLKKRGANQLGLCPFHNEKTPSFTVSPSKNIYKCFGCGRGGNAVQFVMEHEQMNYPESLRYLAAKYGIEIEETQLTNEQKEIQSERESMMIANKYAQEFFEDALFNSNMGKSVGLSYFKKRAFPESIIKSFGLGYAPDGGKEWTEWAQTNSIDIKVSRSLGLTSEKGYDFFRSRVMFPIHNVAGKIIAFAGRSLSNDKRSPKYINSPETLIYDKSNTLYGLHLAKRMIVSEDECILVEGYTDVISMHMQGIENVVASSGTSLTEGQIKLIRRFTQQVLILFDGDAAGQKAALRGIDLLLKQDLNIRVALLPEGHDPDSFIQEKGTNGFKDFIANEAQDFIVFKSSALLKDVQDNPIKKTVVIKDIVSSIALIPDALKRNLYVQHVAQLYQLPEQVLIDILTDNLQSKLKKEKRIQRKEETAPSQHIIKRVKDSESAKTDEFQEDDILRILIGLGHNYFPGVDEYTVGQYILANLADVLDKEEIFDSAIFIKVIKEYNRIQDEKGEVKPQDFLRHADAEISKKAVDLLSEKHEYSDNWAKRHDIFLNTQDAPELNFKADCESGLLRLKLRKINKLIEQNKERLIALTNAPDEKLKVALEVHSRLIFQRNEMAELLRQVVL